MRVYPRARMLWKTKIGSGWGGGQSSATTCQLFVVPRKKMRKEEREGDRYFLDTVAMYRQLETVGALGWAFSWNAAFTVPTSSLCFLPTAHHKTYCRTCFFKPFTSMTSTQMLGFGFKICYKFGHLHLQHNNTKFKNVGFSVNRYLGFSYLFYFICKQWLVLLFQSAG